MNKILTKLLICTLLSMSCGIQAAAGAPAAAPDHTILADTATFETSLRIVTSNPNGIHSLSFQKKEEGQKILDNLKIIQRWLTAFISAGRPNRYRGSFTKLVKASYMIFYKYKSHSKNPYRGFTLRKRKRESKDQNKQRIKERHSMLLDTYDTVFDILSRDSELMCPEEGNNPYYNGTYTFQEASDNILKILQKAVEASESNDRGYTSKSKKKLYKIALSLAKMWHLLYENYMKARLQRRLFSFRSKQHETLYQGLKECLESLERSNSAPNALKHAYSSVMEKLEEECSKSIFAPVLRSLKKKGAPVGRRSKRRRGAGGAGAGAGAGGGGGSGSGSGAGAGGGSKSESQLDRAVQCIRNGCNNYAAPDAYIETILSVSNLIEAIIHRPKRFSSNADRNIINLHTALCLRLTKESSTQSRNRHAEVLACETELLFSIYTIMKKKGRAIPPAITAALKISMRNNNLLKALILSLQKNRTRLAEYFLVKWLVIADELLSKIEDGETCLAESLRNSSRRQNGAINSSITEKLFAFYTKNRNNKIYRYIMLRIENLFRFLEYASLTYPDVLQPLIRSNRGFANVTQAFEYCRQQHKPYMPSDEPYIFLMRDTYDYLWTAVKLHHCFSKEEDRTFIRLHKSFLLERLTGANAVIKSDEVVHLFRLFYAKTQDVASKHMSFEILNDYLNDNNRLKQGEISKIIEYIEYSLTKLNLQTNLNGNVQVWMHMAFILMERVLQKFPQSRRRVNIAYCNNELMHWLSHSPDAPEPLKSDAQAIQSLLGPRVPLVPAAGLPMAYPAGLGAGAGAGGGMPAVRPARASHIPAAAGNGGGGGSGSQSVINRFGSRFKETATNRRGAPQGTPAAGPPMAYPAGAGGGAGRPADDSDSDDTIASADMMVNPTQRPRKRRKTASPVRVKADPTLAGVTPAAHPPMAPQVGLGAGAGAGGGMPAARPARASHTPAAAGNGGGGGSGAGAPQMQWWRWFRDAGTPQPTRKATYSRQISAEEEAEIKILAEKVSCKEIDAILSAMQWVKSRSPLTKRMYCIYINAIIAKLYSDKKEVALEGAQWLIKNHKNFTFSNGRDPLAPHVEKAKKIVMEHKKANRGS